MIEVAAGWDKSQQASKLHQVESPTPHDEKLLEALGHLETLSRSATLGRSTMHELTEVNYLRAGKLPYALKSNLMRKGQNMITVTALALLIYLFGGYVDSERRQNDECTKS
jgi:hypothetical protein